MCGRAACTLDPDRVVSRFKPKDGFRNRSKYRPSFNVAPYSSNHLPVVSQREDPSHALNTDVAAMQWGLKPSWFKDTQEEIKLFNTRVGMQQIQLIQSYLKLL